MPRTLDQLLESIDPTRTVDETAARMDDAINSYRIRDAVVYDWISYKRRLIDFMAHVEANVLRVPAMPPCSLDFAWGRCVKLLVKEYGTNGEKAAFELARTGNDGGLYRVMKRLAQRMALNYGNNEVTARIGVWWNGLTVTEKLVAVDKYVEKYGHLLPSEITEAGAIRVKANFPKALQAHVQQLQRMRRVGR